MGPDRELRDYRTTDAAAVVALLQRSLPVWRRDDAPARFLWKHEANPFGVSRRVVMEHDGQVVGFYARMAWRLSLDGRELTACRSVDGAVHPAYRRQGIGKAFAALHIEEVEVPRTPDVHLTHGNAQVTGLQRQAGLGDGSEPTVRHLPADLGRLAAWRRRGRVDRLHPGPAAVPLRTLLDDEPQAVGALLDRRRGSRYVVTAHTPASLRWRYVDEPGETYAALTLRDGTRLRALAVVRCVAGVPGEHPGHLEVSELFVEDDDHGALRGLLHRARRARAPYVAVVFPPWATRADVVAVGALRGYELGIFRGFGLADGLPDLTDLSRWVLPLGDLRTI